LHADMENLRRRTLREKEEIWQIAAADVLVQLIPTLDNFDRALKVLPDHDWAQGITMVSKQLQDTLERFGLEQISTQGAFDPQYHEAIMQDNESNEPENTITGEFERGFLFRGKVLRPSKVRVSTGGSPYQHASARLYFRAPVPPRSSVLAPLSVSLAPKLALFLLRALRSYLLLPLLTPP